MVSVEFGSQLMVDALADEDSGFPLVSSHEGLSPAERASDALKKARLFRLVKGELEGLPRDILVIAVSQNEPANEDRETLLAMRPPSELQDIIPEVYGLTA